MTEPKRLFDCLEYHLKENRSLPNMLAAKENGKWKTYSTQEVKTTVDKLAAGLLNLGIQCGDMTAEGRDKIAILSKNRPEWLMLDLAVQKTGAILTPIYPTISVQDLEFVLQDAQVKMVFVNDEELFHKVLAVKDKLPSLKEIFTFEHVANARHWKEILTLSSEAALQKVESIAGKIMYEDLVTIIYTSGTTGTPKGVMLSHRNILSNVIDCSPYLPVFPGMTALSFLPLNHIFERMLSYFYMYRGIPIYYAESLDTIGENLKEVQPGMFTTVPRLLEKVYDRIMAKGAELTGIKRKLFYWAHSLAERYEINKPMGMLFNLQLALANKLIFSKWREGLGNNIKCIVSGGAACQPRLIRIFTAAQIPILEGYGLTETSPVIAVNRYEITKRQFGTVGPPIDNVEVKIADDGEILCKGPNVMMGYYKRPDLTAEEMTGEWFHTGDIGTMVGENLRITDRKKEMFKTSGGKYVAPLPIENKLKESIYVEQIMVVGADKKFVGALIIPAFPALKDWARKQGLADMDHEELIKHPKVHDLYRELIDSYNKFFNHVEQIKRFELLPREWSIETGEMTPKMSIKRKVVMEKYRHAIDHIYS